MSKCLFRYFLSQHVSTLSHSLFSQTGNDSFWASFEAPAWVCNAQRNLKMPPAGLLLFFWLKCENRGTKDGSNSSKRCNRCLCCLSWPNPEASRQQRVSFSCNENIPFQAPVLETCASLLFISCQKVGVAILFTHLTGNQSIKLKKNVIVSLPFLPAPAHYAGGRKDWFKSRFLWSVTSRPRVSRSVTWRTFRKHGQRCELTGPLTCEKQAN